MVHRQAETSKEAENRSCGRFSCGPQFSSFASGRSPTLFLALFPILAGSCLQCRLSISPIAKSPASIFGENYADRRREVKNGTTLSAYLFSCNILYFLEISYTLRIIL